MHQEQNHNNSQNQIEQENQLVGWNQVSDNWVNAQTLLFLKSLSFGGYILAGNSVANMFQQIPLQGDLDFWASQAEDYLHALNQMKNFYTNFNVYPSMVQMYHSKNSLPRLNLIFTQMTNHQTIQRFDFDYCRCFWTPQLGINFGTGCKQSIITKVIRYPSDSNRIMKKRILKALNYGYVFTYNFWMYQTHLLHHPETINRRNYQHMAPIKKEDLNLNKFRLRQIKLKITNINNTKLTLKQLADQYQGISNKANDGIKLPILVKLQTKNIKLLDDYVLSIVLQNPMLDAHYLRIKLGTRFVSTYSNRHDQQVQNQPLSQSSSQSQSQPSQNEMLPQELPVKQINSKINQININSKNIKTITPQKGQQTLIKLNKSGSAYIILQYLPEHLNRLGLDTFNQMWKLHPLERHKIIIYQQQFQVSRYSQSYLNTPISGIKQTKSHSYMYSGYDSSKNKQDLPLMFVPYLSYMKQKNPKYNQVMANWYEDKDDFIALHSDDQRGMIQNAEVAIISFYPTEDIHNVRTLEIVPKTSTKSLYDKLEIKLIQGLIIKMCGKTQNQYVHGIPKQNKPTTQRLSLSFRQITHDE